MVDKATLKWLAPFLHPATHVDSASGIPSWIDLKVSPLRPFVKPTLLSTADPIPIGLKVCCRLCREASEGKGGRLRLSKVQAAILMTEGAPIRLLPSILGGELAAKCASHGVAFGFRTALKKASSKEEKEKQSRKDRAALFAKVKDSGSLHRFMQGGGTANTTLARTMLEKADVSGTARNADVARAAKAGDRVAQAWCLLTGQGLPGKRPQLGHEILKKLHAEGDAAATHFLGWALSSQHSLTSESDDQASAELVKDAASRGFAPARKEPPPEFDELLDRLGPARSDLHPFGFTAPAGSEQKKRKRPVQQQAPAVKRQTKAKETKAKETKAKEAKETKVKETKVKEAKAKEAKAKEAKTTEAPRIWSEAAVAEVRAKHAREVALLHNELQKGAAEVKQIAQQWAEEKRILQEQREILETKLAFSQGEMDLLRDQLGMLNKIAGHI